MQKREDENEPQLYPECDILILKENRFFVNTKSRWEWLSKHSEFADGSNCVLDPKGLGPAPLGLEKILYHGFSLSNGCSRIGKLIRNPVLHGQWVEFYHLKPQDFHGQIALVIGQGQVIGIGFTT